MKVVQLLSSASKSCLPGHCPCLVTKRMGPRVRNGDLTNSPAHPHLLPLGSNFPSLIPRNLFLQELEGLNMLDVVTSKENIQRKDTAVSLPSHALFPHPRNITTSFFLVPEIKPVLPDQTSHVHHYIVDTKLPKEKLLKEKAPVEG